MPEMNGHEASRQIRSMEERDDGACIPIVAMTANAFAEDVQDSLRAGMDAHLSKPVMMDDLIKTVSRLVKADRIKEDRR